MSGQTIITVLLAVVAGSGASIITGLFTMPQVKAGAKTTRAEGEVAISGDAREWAKTFAEQAAKADKRADEAEDELEVVKRELRDCKIQCEELSTRLDNWQAYAVRMQVTLKAQGIAVPPPPE